MSIFKPSLVDLRKKVVELDRRAGEIEAAIEVVEHQRAECAFRDDNSGAMKAAGEGERLRREREHVHMARAEAERRIAVAEAEEAAEARRRRGVALRAAVGARLKAVAEVEGAVHALAAGLEAERQAAARVFALLDRDRPFGLGDQPLSATAWQHTLQAFAQGCGLWEIFGFKLRHDPARIPSSLIAVERHAGVAFLTALGEQIEAPASPSAPVAAAPTETRSAAA